VAATRSPAAVEDRAEALDAIAAEGGRSALSWGNGPGHRYGTHSHGYHKMLFCLAGSIVFHTEDGDVELRTGDRLDLEPGTEHSATVGPDGCECVEAWR
jgi:AraC-like ligand binding domain